MTNPDNPLEAINALINGAESVMETAEQVITRLSTLSVVEYEQVRKDEAAKLHMRASILDDAVAKIRKDRNGVSSGPALHEPIIPSTELVDGVALLDELKQTIKEFIVCNDDVATAAALWIAFTWFIDDVQVSPIAIITAPEKRCGKSQMLALMSKLVRQPLVASNISPSAIFRVVECMCPTLLIDEADTFLRDNEEARGIINSGHTRSSAYVIRNVGDDHEPKQFSTWGAKVLCGIGKLPDTLMDRAIILELRRKLPNEEVSRIRYAADERFAGIAAKLARYSQDNSLHVRTSRPPLPDTLNDRAQDNWEPLLSIADLAGGHWPDLARRVAVAISGVEHDAPSLNTQLLMDIREIFDGRDKISSRDLLAELNDDDLKPWSTYNRGKPIDARQLAARLSDYNIKPETVRIGLSTPKGYKKSQFTDVFDRYLGTPLDQDLGYAATPQHEPKPSCISRGSVVSDHSARGTILTPSATLNPLFQNDSCAVADEMVASDTMEVEI